jgi:hypothetical protein
MHNIYIYIYTRYTCTVNGDGVSYDEKSKQCTTSSIYHYTGTLIARESEVGSTKPYSTGRKYWSMNTGVLEYGVLGNYRSTT